jgi:aryl-alcohol dehydrogenase-like predicted oxidoreductase
MEKRVLGRTNIEVTRLGFGAMELRGPRIWHGRPFTDEQAERVLNAVLDAGINFIDTSNDYGRSEELIGRYIGHRRGEYFIATKCGCHVTDAGDHDDTPHVWTRENLLRCIDESLSRLKTDYVDLLQLHNPTVAEAEAGGLVLALREIQAAGKTRSIACSSTLPDLAEYISWGVFDAFQIPYSALERAHEEHISRAAAAGAGTIIRGGVARGEPGVGLGRTERWRKWEQARLDELRSEGETPTQFILRFTLTHPDAHTVIVGTLDPAHLEENLAAAERGPLPLEIYAQAKRRLEAIGEKPAA